jgi:hypothetical protein
MSGQLLVPEADHLVLPDGTLWAPEWTGIEPIGLDRVVPRVCMVPTTYAFSSGPEAIELAASAGLILDPWEQLCLILGLGETAFGRWAAFQVALIVARQNGKGSILEALELFWLFGTGERLIGHSAHEYKTAMEAFRRVLFLIENNDWLRKRVKKIINTNGEEGIELLTGQRLRFMARSKGAGRGFTFHKLVWDEAYALTREQQDAQLPTMSAVDNPQIWVTSSPPLTSDTGAVLFQLRRMAEAMGEQLTFLDYGAAGSLDALEEIDLDDRELWKRTNPSEIHAGSGHGVSMETMERERAAMSDIGFARERLCIWPPDLTEGFGVITKDQWAAMCDPYSGKDRYEELPATMRYWPAPDTPPSDPAWTTPPTTLVGRPVLAIRVSPRNQGIVRASIGLARRRQDGARHIELIKRGTGTGWVVSDAVLLAGNLKAAAIVIDPGGPAGSLLADLETAVKAAGLSDEIIIKQTSRDVASAFGMIYDAANETTPNVFHIGQSELDLAVGGGVKRPVGIEGHAWDARAATTDITPIASVTDALWGLAQVGTQEPEDEPLVMWA